MTPDHAALIPFRRLALAVLDSAVKDAHAGRRDAETFLDDDQSLSPWSELLGLKPSTVRRAAHRQDWASRYARARLFSRHNGSPRRHPPPRHRIPSRSKICLPSADCSPAKDPLDLQLHLAQLLEQLPHRGPGFQQPHPLDQDPDPPPIVTLRRPTWSPAFGEIPGPSPGFARALPRSVPIPVPEPRASGPPGRAPRRIVL